MDPGLNADQPWGPDLLSKIRGLEITAVAVAVAVSVEGRSGELHSLTDPNILISRSKVRGLSYVST